MPDRTVYRSSAPEVLAVLDAYRAETQAWQERAKAFLAEFGFADRHLVITNGLGGRHVIGVEVRDEDHNAPPAGWRVADRGMLVLLPDKRRKTGKDADRRIDECQPPRDPRTCLPGMPGDFMTGGEDGQCRLIAPAMQERGGVLYVIWSTDKVQEIPAEGPERLAYFGSARHAMLAPAVDREWRQIRTGIDLAFWQRVKLSAWHALLEDEEATADA